ncbi:glycerophosphodiester phosphodiesterase family protein [Actinocorallia sp. A-T 12471]|uniref:glycerophosphodiester phosphodiesterase family protein n=1 Tax=Actinocorallia sp. A-T 12471 TaxID=3089813 RepID=UPI0029D09E43|nr:glycerophosphodiester phosphodiesterase family protein [Actinocorallia sp. A-T 12471]MDX6741215.1 glycerophosphodiester phosphodiesterase family protein [Actinocorallia sp. A-T 12471]
MRYAFLEHDGPIAFAHRGGALGAPENTMTAFQRAVDVGYRYIETDVQATADGALLAFHDADLARVTGEPGRIARLPYQRVARARIHGTEPIPLLEDALGSFPDIRFNIDIKDRPAIGPLIRVLHRTQAWSRVCVTSFSTRRLARARAQAAVFTREPVCTALGPSGVAAVRIGGRAARIAASGVACAQIPHVLGPVPFATASFVAQAHAVGLAVHAWTVNGRAAMARVLDAGVDGVMTDDLEALREVMAGRGLWSAAGA